MKVGAGAGFVEYRTFPDTFTKVLAHFPAGWDQASGPHSLRAFTKGGAILDYGAGPSGRALAKSGAVRA